MKNPLAFVLLIVTALCLVVPEEGWANPHTRRAARRAAARRKADIDGKQISPASTEQKSSSHDSSDSKDKTMPDSDEETSPSAGPSPPDAAEAPDSEAPKAATTPVSHSQQVRYQHRPGGWNFGWLILVAMMVFAGICFRLSMPQRTEWK